VQKINANKSVVGALCSHHFLKEIIMDRIVLIWLLLAGPLWAAIGAYWLPLAYERKGIDEPRARLAGLIGGFALGPVAVGYLSARFLRMNRSWLLFTGIVGVFIVSQIITRISNPNVPVVLWLLFAGPVWAALGTYFVPRRYRVLGLDDTNTSLVGTLGGFAGGPFVLLILWFDTPKLSRNWVASLSVLVVWQLYTIFALYYPTNLCVQTGSVRYLTQQTLNGLTIGMIYALMAVGLTLIYSVQGIVSFAHGQFYMIGGFISFYFLTEANKFTNEFFGFDVNPIFGILVSGFLAFLIGIAFERYFLRPMHLGQIERVVEYAILITFGLGFVMEYTTQWIVGASAAVRSPTAYLAIRTFRFETELGSFILIASRVVAMGIGLVLILALLDFLRNTWTGRALRAVSMDKQAAAVTGVNPLNMNTLAFGMGAMLAGMAGAALIPVFSIVPQVGAEMAGRSYVIVVLGGLGSVPGALVGGLIVGVVEALGAGCFPDPSRGAAYKEAFSLIIFALVLLLRPTGLFGREQL
jgi:branched-chain amino acid transport system permease protein